MTQEEIDNMIEYWFENGLPSELKQLIPNQDLGIKIKEFESGVSDVNGKMIAVGDTVTYSGEWFKVCFGSFYWESRGVGLIGIYLENETRKIPLFPSDKYEIIDK
ncbi:hypothetical protein [Streptococcus agalactiae]|uniref:YopX protein domain-containing protein n=1 Tax=Streptococcus agalactiae MRI Z1-216 TaxID=1154879 RepID=A0AAD2WWZ2_STRAG|nr:hypothetical protein [Streptococcus agalactiae]EPU31272.1 hypothetical protein SAG0161_00845 [Streptococcus agalactiae MRI Z1-213]EPU36751.1 hypothetical protein SAG0162_05390 [Streptococcus agalactiae MRI Z1-214]EPU39653.1 hypothetical protein SAG0164_06650 [Streptococcus agalactiae MRI Z1-216]EPX05935.1 hypothetical protein SAG0165_02070 [Streptococcus agalactiae MRI Z1-217]